MRKLPFTLIVLVISINLFSQTSPHGEALVSNCTDCHTTTGWKLESDPVAFNHAATKFPLVGQHKAVACKKCHVSLEFSKAETDCYLCHTDMHQQTLGNECSRCHTPNSWIVTNTTQLHQQSRFPLIGPHTTANCKDCHTNYVTSTPSSSMLRFDQLGVECYDCHKADYMATTAPNHAQSSYSTNCTECHNMNAFEWSGAGINHNFFPLTGGHEISDCKECHTSGSYSKIPSECVSCHQSDYNSTVNPNHTALNFSTTCNECHNLNPGWKPAEYRNHDAVSFPIYSGEHNGEWNSCSDCHTNPSNYADFTCTNCHEHNKGEMDDEHGGLSGYEYNSPSCYACHPTGSAEGGFDHNKSAFPLTGAHTTTDCASCHTSGYAGTSNVCASCHTNDYNQTANPNHTVINIPTDCATCHTTNPDWNPATFPTHNDYYVLAGAHVPIANDCATCHNGNYINTPNSCYECHKPDYDQSTNPPHLSAQFSTTCEECHTQNVWKPSTFDHDGPYFPIYSGKHNGEWNLCSECHTNASNYALFTCTTACHPKGEMDSGHDGVNGYLYNSNECLACHPAGSAEGVFNHSQSPFPLTGSHATTECASCHTSGYAGTSSVCASCHTNDYNQTANPNHTVSNIPTDCATCHTTNPDWNPATFPTHNNYYALAGAHVAITNDCATCHNNNYTSTPNTCNGCHNDNYIQTTNPNHVSLQFSTECETCHFQTTWVPSTFDHNASYALTGAHTTVADNCAQCHANGYSNTPNTCNGCHQSNYTQATNPNHITLGIPDDCVQCHTTNPDWNPATFPTHNNYYVLAGAHIPIANDCATCHNGTYSNTPNTCSGCHLTDYNQTTNPNHATAQFPHNCEVCHTQNVWNPSTFNHDAQYFPIYSGKHYGVWNLCSECHTNSSNYASFTCTTTCHPQATTNNDHSEVSGYSYNSNACLDCHPKGTNKKSIENGINRLNLN